MFKAKLEFILKMSNDIKFVNSEKISFFSNGFAMVPEISPKFRPLRCRCFLKMIFFQRFKFIINKHSYITKALEDREGQLAVLMALMQIGEILNKIERDILKKYHLLDDAKGAYSVRNFFLTIMKG